MATKLELETEIAILKKDLAKEKEGNNNLLFFIKSASVYLGFGSVDPLDKTLDGVSGVDEWSPLCNMIEGFSEETREVLEGLGARLKEVVEERSLISSLLDSLEIIPEKVTCLDACDQLAFIKHEVGKMEALLKGSYDKTTTEGLFRLKLLTVANGR